MIGLMCDTNHMIDTPMGERGEQGIFGGAQGGM